MYTQTSEAIKAFKNQNESYTGAGSGSQTATQQNFGAFDPDFDISKTVNEIEQVAHHVKVSIEDNLNEPLVNTVKEKVVKPVVNIMEEKLNIDVKIKDMSNVKSGENLSSQATVNLNETVKVDPVEGTTHSHTGVDKMQKVDDVSLNKVDFDKVEDLGLAGPKISVTENVVENFKSTAKQPKQPKPKNKIMSEFKPQVSQVEVYVKCFITILRKLANAIYRDFLSSKNKTFYWKKIGIFAQNIDCGYTKAVLTSTRNLCLSF